MFPGWSLANSLGYNTAQKNNKNDVGYYTGQGLWLFVSPRFRASKASGDVQVHAGRRALRRAPGRRRVGRRWGGGAQVHDNGSHLELLGLRILQINKQTSGSPMMTRRVYIIDQSSSPSLVQGMPPVWTTLFFSSGHLLDKAGGYTSLTRVLPRAALNGKNPVHGPKVGKKILCTPDSFWQVILNST